MKLTKEQFKGLDLPSQKLANELGIAPKIVSEKKLKLPLLQGHDLEVTSVCKLCKAIDIRYFSLQDKGNGYLESEVISSAEIHSDVQKKKIEVEHCILCRRNLLNNYSRKELVDKLIEVVIKRRR